MCIFLVEDTGKTLDLARRSEKWCSDDTEGSDGSSVMGGGAIFAAARRGVGDERGEARKVQSSSKRRPLNSWHSFNESCMREFKPLLVWFLWWRAFSESFLTNKCKSLMISKVLKLASGQNPRPKDSTSITIGVRVCVERFTTMLSVGLIGFFEFWVVVLRSVPIWWFDVNCLKNLWVWEWQMVKQWK